MARWAYLLAGAVSLGMTAAAVAVVGTACLPGLIAPDAGVDSGNCNGVPCCGDGIIEPQMNETCDPGSVSAPFCDRCSLQCPTPDGGASGTDKTSSHCYASLPGRSTEAEATTLCGRLGARAHVVTLVDQDEATFLQGGPLDVAAARYWVGLGSPAFGDAGEVEYNSVRLTSGEPGWAASSFCSGCYAPGVGQEQALETVDGGRDAGSAVCVAANNATTAVAIGCNARSKVICEHEPEGSRAQTCPSAASRLQGYCFDLIATAKPLKKHYFYSTAPGVAASVAVSRCTTFGGQGSPSGTLVVLESGAEREQLIWELFQSGQFMDGLQFWIGLSAQKGDGGVVSTWDDFRTHPSVWGFAEPPTDTTQKLRAFLSVSSRFDTGLAQTPVSDSPNYLPFVCQWSDP
jgi:hypothetical protein